MKRKENFYNLESIQFAIYEALSQTGLCTYKYKDNDEMQVEYDLHYTHEGNIKEFVKELDSTDLVMKESMIVPAAENPEDRDWEMFEWAGADEFDKLCEKMAYRYMWAFFGKDANEVYLRDKDVI